MESPARCRRSVRWLFWKLANVFVEEGRGERGSDRNRAWGRWNSRGQGRGTRAGAVFGDGGGGTTLARDRLTSRRAAPEPGPQKRSCRWGARGAGSEDGKWGAGGGCQGHGGPAWAGEPGRSASGEPGAGGRNTEGLSVVAKVGMASRSCTPRATQNAPPAPPRLPCCPLPRS